MQMETPYSWLQGLEDIRDALAAFGLGLSGM